MKKLLLITLSFIMATMVNAGVVTPEQALQQAQKFIQTREDAGSRTSKTPGTPAQLSMATQVSGLYVFNVANDGGFVIVSNDDRTVPILGFSDSGSIDPDDMPDNMRAWLQGYADEIVWLNEHSIIVNVPESANAPRHADRHSTTAIEPLVQTKWNQTMPYNKLCP
ncbi:MAG: Spi family protease inhibitor, partial [Prevotella sp.]